VKPIDSKITLDGQLEYGKENYSLYLQRVEMAVNSFFAACPVDAEVLFYAIQRDSGVNAETFYTGNADTNYLLGMRDMGNYLVKFMQARNLDRQICKRGKEAIENYIKQNGKKVDD
jgi:hypothetical protein